MIAHLLLWQNWPIGQSVVATQAPPGGVLVQTPLVHASSVLHSLVFVQRDATVHLFDTQILPEPNGQS